MNSVRSNFYIFLLLGVFLFISCFQKQAKKSLSENPTTDQWINLEEDENYTARHECSFVQAGNHFVMFGGREQSRQLDMYDFKKNAWTIGGKAPKEFNHFQATFYEGFIWVIGAFKTNDFPKEIPAENVWLYFTPTQQWIKGPEIPEGRRRGGAGLVVHDDKFYVLGGNTIGHDGGYVSWFDEYDPYQNIWTPLEDASEARDHFHASIMDNLLYAAGGRKSGGEGGFFAPLVQPVDVYDFKSKKWSLLPNPLPTPRAAPGVAVFQNELFVMGGEGSEPMGNPAFKLVEAYNPSTKNWSRKADMNHPRHGTQAIVSGEGIFIASGSPVVAGGRQHNMEVYNKNTPKGFSVKNSTLEAPKEISFKKGLTQKMVLSNKGGNTGCFVSTAKIKGKAKENFKLLDKSEFKLIKSNGQLEISIQQLKPTIENAQLEIIYNGNQKLEISLRGKRF